MSSRTYSGANCLPSPWVWAVVVCLLLLSFVVYRFFFEEGVYTRANFAFITVNSKRLQKFTGKEGGEAEFRVVSLGTSLTRAATYTEGSGKYSGAGFPGSMTWLNISRPGGRFDHFTPLLPQVLAVHPDVLLIHADLLRMADYKRRLYMAGRDCRILFERWLGKVTGFVLLHNDNSVEDEWRRQNSRLCGGTSPDGVNDERIAKKTAQYSQEVVLPPSFIELVEQARERGIRIVVLYVSRQSVFRQHYSRLLGEWMVSLQRVLLPFRDISIWISPGNFEKEDYCDFAHMNENGREKFAAWITPQLAALKSEIQP